jgi:hypothetical protein
MANLGKTFDTTNQQGQTSYEILPAGDYLMQVVQSEVRPTKDGSNKYVWLELDILDGEYAGRKFWERLNLWSTNDTAKKIANQTLVSMTRACGFVTIEDTEELHFRPFQVKMRVKKNGKTGELENSAIYIAAEDGGAPQARGPAPAPAAGRPAPTASAGAKAPPWAAHRR